MIKLLYEKQLGFSLHAFKKFFCFIYLKEIFAEKKRKKEKKKFPSIGSFLQWPHKPGLDQELGALSEGLNRGVRTRAIFCCLPRCISREPY